MIKNESLRRYDRWRFYILELSIYIPGAFFSFIGNYFNQIHLSNFQNGVLGSISAVVLLLSNPFWMRIADRRVKNGVLIFLAFGSALLVWGVLIFKIFWFILFTTIAVAFLWTAIVPVAESISLVYSKRGDFSFGVARMMGSIGYALIIMVLGYIRDDVAFFAIGSASFILIGVTSFLVPRTKGFNVGRKSHYSFKDVPMAFYRMLLLEIVVLPSSAFGSYFLPILMKTRGEAVSFAGIAMGVPALSEIPFLLFADRIIEFLGVKRMLVIASLLFGLRWMLTWIFANPLVVIVIQGLEFFNWIAIYYAILHYVNFEIDSSHRSDAHTIFWMTTSGFSMILGLALGGWLANTIGVVDTYAFFGILSITGGLFYWIVEHFIKTRKQKNASEYEKVNRS